jgi:hypothetical protein
MSLVIGRVSMEGHISMESISFSFGNQVGSLSAFVDRLAGDARSRVLFGNGCKGRDECEWGLDECKWGRVQIRMGWG